MRAAQRHTRRRSSRVPVIPEIHPSFVVGKPTCFYTTIGTRPRDISTLGTYDALGRVIHTPGLSLLETPAAARDRMDLIRDGYLAIGEGVVESVNAIGNGLLDFGFVASAMMSTSNTTLSEATMSQVKGLFAPLEQVATAVRNGDGHQLLKIGTKFLITAIIGGIIGRGGKGGATPPSGVPKALRVGTSEGSGVRSSTPIGSRRSQMNVPEVNERGTFDGRNYSGHAFDQMQGRGITPTVVENAIQRGVRKPGSNVGTFQHILRTFVSSRTRTAT
jgi:hypothetical protein